MPYSNPMGGGIVRLSFMRMVLCVAMMANPAAAQVSITGEAVEALKPFDEMMAAFLAEHEAPGAAVAIARDGRIIYARGFGLADVERKLPVSPDSLFRIASISKPITGVAVLQLVERGKLRLDDRIVDLLDLNIPDAPQGDPRWKRITIGHLLHHTAGFDRDKSFDPMFKAREFAIEERVTPPAGTKEIIACMVRRPLDFDPGQRMAYSNFGYCLLGRAIEKASGQGYEAYVNEHVLKPVGVTRMKIGATRSTAEGEVRYYDRGKRMSDNLFAGRAEGPGGPGEPGKVPVAYGAWHHESLDAHGGWIASAPDLLRFAAIADRHEVRLPAGGNKTPSVLRDDSIITMFARPKQAGDAPAQPLPPVFYACGWQVRELGNGRINTWHTGALPGTATLLVRRHDGLSWAVLFNGDFGQGNQRLAGLIDGKMHQVAGKVWGR